MKYLSKFLFICLMAVVSFSSCSNDPDAPDNYNPDGSETVGDGSKEKPYSIADVQKLKEGANVWVEGYVVGCIEGTFTYVQDSVKFSAPFTKNNNILIASNADERNIANCIPVRIAGDIRSTLNLKDHPENVGKPVKLLGTIGQYFKAVGLSEVTGYIFEGKEYPTVVEGAYISESFSKTLGSFTSKSGSGELAWKIDYSSAVITGYVNKVNYAGVTYLVSGTVDLSKAAEVYVSFDHAINYENPVIAANHQLLISKDYNGDVNTATWTDLKIILASGKDFNFVSCGKIAVPQEFIGQSKVTVALRHTCNDAKSSTWEVKNFVMANGKGGDITDPTPEDPTAINTKETAFNFAQAKENQGNKTDYKIGWVTGYIVGAAVADTKTVTAITSDKDVVFGTEGVRATQVLIADSPDEKDFRNCISVSFPSGPIRSALNLVDNPGNLGKKIVAMGMLYNHLGITGCRDITAYEFVNP